MSDPPNPPSGATPRARRGFLLIAGLVLVVAGALLFWTRRDGSGDAGEMGHAPTASRSGPRASLPALVEALRSSDGGARAAAARDLGPAIADAIREGGSLAEAQAGVTALAAAVEDREPAVGAAAGTSLVAAFRARPEGGGDSPLDPGPAVAALGRRLASEDRATRTAALAALSGIAKGTVAPPPPELLADLERGTPTDRDQAALALAAFRSGTDPALPVMFHALEAGLPGSAGTMSQAFSNIRSSPASVPLLVEKLGHPRADVRARAAQILGRIGPEARDAIPPLVRVLANSDPSGIEGPEVPRDFRGYSTHHDPAAEAAAQAIGKIVAGTDAAPAVVHDLAAALNDAPATHRRVYAYTLGLLGKAAAPAVPSLTRTLRAELAEPSTPGTGQRLAWALGEVAPGTPEAGPAVAALADALASEDASTATMAAEALGRFGPEAAPAVPKLRELGTDPQRAGLIERVLGRIKPGS